MGQVATAPIHVKSAKVVLPLELQRWLPSESGMRRLVCSGGSAIVYQLRHLGLITGRKPILPA